MKKQYYSTVILVLAIGFCARITEAETIVKKGQVGFRFLTNPVSAEAIGRGGLGVVTFNNSNAVFWNPAGLGWLDGNYDFNANYTRGIADINYSALVGAIRLGRIGFLALDMINVNYGELNGTRRANNEHGFEDTGVFSPTAYALGLTFSQKVSNRFSYGVRAKYAVQDLGSAWIGVEGTDVDDSSLVMETKAYNLGEPALDIGATYDFLTHGIRFGAVMQNFSRETRYERDKFPLPFSVSFSLCIQPLTIFLPHNEIHSLVLGFETNHPRDFREKVKFGAEYAFQGMFIARLGYMGNYDEQGLTAGLGMRREFSDFNLRLDYAYQDFGIFSAVHTFTFGVTY
jgi:hypothetical protein